MVYGDELCADGVGIVFVDRVPTIWERRVLELLVLCDGVAE
jgi:hypothetical protein